MKFKSSKNALLKISCLVCAAVWAASPLQEEDLETEIMAAMTRASRFMMDTVSYRGGFLWRYSEDLGVRWGELPARKTQVWVELSTPHVGLMFLQAHRVTGEAAYLQHARKVAKALVHGQLPEGGWNYFFDFDMSGVRDWYQEVAKQSWAWEEYYHYYGNATFDDDTTTGPLRFLLRLYDATLDPAFRTPLLRGLEFVLEAQYPNGAWPQRYPLKPEFPKDGRPDYTAFYTFNDDVMSNCVHLLLEAYERIGDERYYEAARRGMDFYVLSQLPEPQSGWAQQYQLDMTPGQARSYEPAALSVGDTIDNSRELMDFYRITGDRRYLEPIPKALRWLQSAELDGGLHARFYDPETNEPIFVYYEKLSRMKDRFWFDSEYREENYYPYGRPSRLDLSGLHREYERVRSLSADEARKEYRESLEGKRRWPVIPRIDSNHDNRIHLPDREEALAIARSLDSRGAWILDDMLLSDRENFVKNPPQRLRGVDTLHFVAQMYRLVRFLEERSSVEPANASGE